MTDQQRDRPSQDVSSARQAPGGRGERLRRPLWKRRWVRVAACCVAAFLIVVGPWPAYESTFRGTPYAGATFGRVAKLFGEGPQADIGPLRAGAAAVEITPALGEPLAGYSARKPMANDGAAEKLYVKALTISNSQKTVTIVGADILLIMSELRDAVLERTALSPDELYFTASHTHSGPGGYSSGWVDQLVLGRFDEKILGRLADAFAEAVTRSREQLTPARVGFARAAVAAAAANRIQEGGPLDDRAACLVLSGPKGRIIGGIVSFSAHPTCLGRKNRKAGGDYPGVVQRGMSERFGGVWLFAVGACGSVKIVSPQPRGPKRVADVGGRVLAASMALGSEAMGGESPVAASAWRASTIPLASALLEVDLPPLQVRISQNWRLSPVISSLVHGRTTYIQVLVAGRLVLLGMPCDYSGELANRLESAPGEGLKTLVTSFNGDYIGYLLPRDRYQTKHYETRDANFFGPWCGEYFDELSRRILRRVGKLRSRQKLSFDEEVP